MGKVLPFQNKLKLEVGSDTEIIELLTKFENNFQQGEKSIAFSSTNYRSSQEKSILLAIDYFNQKYPTLRLCVVSFQIESGLFKELLFNGGEAKSYETYRVNRQLDFVDWAKVLKKDPLDIVDEYDMVLWDLPDLEFIQREYDRLHTYFEHMDALYIVSLKHKKFDDEHFKRTISDFYRDHGLNIRSILPWTIGKKKNKRQLHKDLIERIKSLFF